MEEYKVVIENKVITIPEDVYIAWNEDKDRYIFNGETLVDNPDYPQIVEERERARVQELFMTRSDFFDGTIKAFGADENDLLPMIEQALWSLGIDEIQKKIVLNNYKNALNFYRKHPLFTMLSNTDIPVGNDVSIRITSEQWDRFFDETDKKNPDAYKELLPREEV